MPSPNPKTFELESELAKAAAHHDMGLQAAQAGQFATALPYLQAALAINPTLEKYSLSYARALLSLGQTSEAQAVLKAARQQGHASAALNTLQEQAHMIELAAMFNAGEPAAAEGRARAVLQQYPDSGFAWKVLGACLYTLKKPDALLALLRAAELMPEDAEAQFNLGNAQNDLGQLDAAAASYRRALAAKPDYAEAYYNLGIVQKNLGKTDIAIASYRQAILAKPDYAAAHSNLGAILQELGQFSLAQASYRRALEIQPGDALTHNNLGVALQELEQFEMAAQCFDRALALKPDFADAYANLAAALQSLGRPDEAVASCQCALGINATHRDAYKNMGNALLDLGRLDEAFDVRRQALAIDPASAEAHFNLGVVQQAMMQLEPAAVSYRNALKIQPDHLGALGNLGDTLLNLNHIDEASAIYGQVMQMKPDLATVHNNMGSALLDISQFDAAEASFRKALVLKPDYQGAQSNLLFALNYHPDKSAEDIFAAYRQFDEHFGQPLRAQWRPHSNHRHTARRLKVGYVSPDFRQHACVHFLEPLLAHHDKQAVEVYAYAELVKPDAASARFEGYVDHWVPTRGLSDEALAERIRADGIDILVDLAGHTAQNRLRVFARKPAPVSVSWLGFGYTTGLGAIDYYLSDAPSVPAGSEGLFAERPWRMRTPCYAFRPNSGMGEVNALPALERGYVTFGTLTRAVRINHHTIRVWSALLKAVPDSRLVIDSRNFTDAAVQTRLADKFAQHGISRERLQIGFHSPPWNVLRGMDIGLDCFPHNSGTTLFESLYLGVPFVTLAGRPSVGRLGSSILHGLGHPEWIASSEAQYIQIAADLAADLPRLAALRAGLRSEMQHSALMDETGFARHVEAAYQGMWQAWCTEGVN